MFNFNTPKWPTLDLETIKQRGRLLVIDDLDFPYKVLFEKDGYLIDKWDDVKDLHKLETGYYDLILLDLQGVAKELSPQEGRGLLKHIKKINPSQIVFAYSNAEWSLKNQDFFQIADKALAKNQDYYVFKQAVDEFLVKRFSIDYYLEKIEKAIPNSSYIDKHKVKFKMKKLILKKETAKIEDYLSSQSLDANTINTIATIANSAIGVFQICLTLL